MDDRLAVSRFGSASIDGIGVPDSALNDSSLPVLEPRGCDSPAGTGSLAFESFRVVDALRFLDDGCSSLTTYLAASLVPMGSLRYQVSECTKYADFSTYRLAATNNTFNEVSLLWSVSLNSLISSALYKVHPNFLQFCAMPEVPSLPSLRSYFLVLSKYS